MENVEPGSARTLSSVVGGSGRSHAWLDIGREFTEVWHHGAQIRDAVAPAPFRNPDWLHAVLAIAVHAIPHAYRDVRRPVGQSLALEILGRASGSWTLTAREIGLGDRRRPLSASRCDGDA